MTDLRPRSTEGAARPVVDTGWCWVVLLASHVIFFLWEGLCKSQGVLLLTLTVQFDTETWPVGWVVGLMLAARGISGLMLGPLEKRWQHRTIAIWSSILASAGLIASAFTTNVVQFGLLLVLVTGGACGLLLNCSLVLLGHYFDRYYAMANGIASAGTALGILVMAPVTQFLLDVYGWRGCLLLIGGLFLHLIAAAALFRPLPQHHDHHRYTPGESGYKTIDDSDSEDARENVGCELQGGGQKEESDDANLPDAAPSSTVSRIVRASGLNLFASLSFVVLVACISNLCIVIVAWVIFTVPHALVKGLSPYQASTVAVTGALGILTGQLGHGPLVDKDIVGARALMYVANFLMGAAYLMDPFLDQLWPLLAGNFLFGIGFGVALPLSFTMLRRLVGGERMTVAVGWAEAVGSIVRIIASWLIGWMYDRTGSYDISFVIIGSVPCLTIVVLLFEDAGIFLRARKGRR